MSNIKESPVVTATDERYRYWKSQLRFLRDCQEWVGQHAQSIRIRQRYFGDVDPDSIEAVNERERIVEADINHAMRQVAYWHRALYDETRGVRPRFVETPR